jgi:hypothetical protein
MSRHVGIYQKLSSPSNSKINTASKKRHELFPNTSYNAYINTCNLKKTQESYLHKARCSPNTSLPIVHAAFTMAFNYCYVLLVPS